MNKASYVIYQLVTEPDKVEDGNAKRQLLAYNEAVTFFKYAVDHIKEASSNSTYIGLETVDYKTYTQTQRYIKMLTPLMKEESEARGIRLVQYP